MRIAFLTFEFPDVRPGGVGSYVVKCAQALAAAGHEAHVFTTTLTGDGKYRGEGFYLHEVADVAERVAGGRLPAALGAAALKGSQAAYKLAVGALLCDALRREHRAGKFDLVEAAECEALALPLLLRPVRDLPVVVQIHLGNAVNAFGNNVESERRDHLAEGLELATIVGADAVCAATQSVVDLTRKVCPFKREVTIIPHSAQMRKVEFTPAPRDGAVLFVGRLHRRKGADMLATAADIFLRRRAEATIRIAGADTRDGDKSMLAEMISRVDPAVRNRIVYLGELSQAEVGREIQACRFQVVPSVVENFANTAVDAMAMGRLVIYAGNTGLDEVVGEAGMRVWPMDAEKLAEAMETAWDQPAFAEELGLAGFKRVETKFNVAAVTRQRVEFYEKVIRDHRAGGRREDAFQWDALTAAQTRAVLEAFAAQSCAMLELESGSASPGEMLLGRMRELEERLKREPVVWLFGAGRFATRLLGQRHVWESAGFSVAGIVDEHPRFQERPTYLGLSVLSVRQLCERIEQGGKVDAVILATDTLEEVFRRRAEGLKELGVEVMGLGANRTGLSGR